LLIARKTPVTARDQWRTQDRPSVPDFPEQSNSPDF